MIKKIMLRRKFKEIRDTLSKSFVNTATESIYNQLVDISKNANVIFCYVSFDSEVDTKKYITAMLQQDKIVCVPKINNSSMQAVPIFSLNNLRENKFGILEPANNNAISPDEIDLVIAPCLAFNDKKYRLGYGGGFYDKFLKDNKVKKVMIAYKCQKTDIAFEEPYDVKFDLVITEK